MNERYKVVDGLKMDLWTESTKIQTLISRLECLCNAVWAALGLKTEVRDGGRKMDLETKVAGTQTLFDRVAKMHNRLDCLCNAVWTLERVTEISTKNLCGVEMDLGMGDKTLGENLAEIKREQWYFKSNLDCLWGLVKDGGMGALETAIMQCAKAEFKSQTDILGERLGAALKDQIETLEERLGEKFEARLNEIISSSGFYPMGANLRKMASMDQSMDVIAEGEEADEMVDRVRPDVKKKRLFVWNKSKSTANITNIGATGAMQTYDTRGSSMSLSIDTQSNKSAANVATVLGHVRSVEKAEGIRLPESEGDWASLVNRNVSRP